MDRSKPIQEVLKVPDGRDCKPLHPERHSSDFAEFTRQVLQDIAKALGMPAGVIYRDSGE